MKCFHELIILNLMLDLTVKFDCNNVLKHSILRHGYQVNALNDTKYFDN